MNPDYNIEKLIKIARWVIAENDRGVSAFPRYMAKIAKEGLGDKSPMNRYSSKVRIRKMKHAPHP